MRFAVLGPVRLWRGDVELNSGPPQQRALLALLLAYAGRPVSLDEMVDVLWGQDPPSSSVNVVHRYVGNLRRLLEPGLPPRAEGGWLIRGAGGYRLKADAGTLDLLRFRHLAEQARSAAPAQAVELYAEALAVWQGEAAAGIQAEVRSRPVFAALEQERITVALAAADVALEHGGMVGLLPALRAAATRHPLDERLQARLVLALATTGRQAEALDTWQAVRDELAEELGISPGPELRAAQQRVLTEAAGPSREPTALAVAPTGGAARLAVTPTGEATDLAMTSPASSVEAEEAGEADEAGEAGAMVRPAQLPADLAVFAGRRADLAKALALLDGDALRTVVISAIGGMAGVGKTTLAVHWAHRVADRFPDGQLYVNLRGFDRLGSAMDPAEALRSFLEALGVPPHRIPVAVDVQVGLYRSLLAKRRVLILLDNARDADQVRPLLPSSPGCLVLITSRDRLPGLLATEGALPMTLDLFPAEDARESLARRLGEERVAREPEAVDEIVERCGGLPLALAVVAARAAANPAFPLSAIAAELRETPGTLDAFADGDPAVDVRAVFSWSYRSLSAAAARLFRLLALHPGPDVSAGAAAALAGEPVRRALNELTRASLLTEHAPGRYAAHDLLRAYATELVEGSEDDRDAAVRRLLDHYTQQAHGACRKFAPFWVRPELGLPVPEFDDDRQALAWFTAEHSVLMSVVDLAAQGGFDTHSWQLAWALERFLDQQGHWRDCATVQRHGLAAAERLGHRTAQAHLHRALARASARLGDYHVAWPGIRRSLELYEELNDLSGLATAHRSHAWLLDQVGRYEESIAQAERALDLYAATGNPAGEASMLHALAWTHIRLDQDCRAATYLQDALIKLNGLSNRYGDAGVLDGLGYALHRMGEYDRAIVYYQHALTLYRDVGDRYNEIGTLRHLGDSHRAAGDHDAARASWQHALDLVDEVVDPATADEIRDKLLHLDLPDLVGAERRVRRSCRGGP
ncbi:AfsR/SARP family transcriptional regulator [Nonomuraea sp. NPDC050451]|uniref:AfsR/SARP family transcriptional regulator n=1 Tax=Nonomuraea sp. NPDC050451 TaxID=3364364 RepID=UPI0037BB09F3